MLAAGAFRQAELQRQAILRVGGAQRLVLGDAAALRQLVKKMIGDQAELSHKYYATVNNRELLLRLQNNLKTRLIENEEYHQALQVIETMAAIAPDEA